MDILTDSDKQIKIRIENFHFYLFLQKLAQNQLDLKLIVIFLLLMKITNR